MIRIHTIESSEAAQTYFVHSERADYYAGSPEKPGIWHGKGAQLLGLKGVVLDSDFAALCDNQNPHTKQQLTKRQNKQRRVAFDFNFHPPKSVSQVHALTQDKRIQLAMEKVVTETMQQMEKDMAARVRKDGGDADRITGNMTWAQFTHLHTRPVEDESGRLVPDPHLHCHCVCFNATFDKKENCWKAAQIGDIKRDAPYYEACFHNRLIRALKALGYGIDIVDGKWEIKGVPPTVIAKFSNRSDAIDKARQKKEAKLGRKLNEKEAADLGQQTRHLKKDADDMSPLELRQVWMDRLNKDERNSLLKTYHEARSNRRKNSLKGVPKDDSILSKHLVDYSIQHHFERASVMDRRRLLTDAIKLSYGEVEHQSIERTFDESNVLTYQENNRTWCTTHEVLEEEKAFIDFAREGRHACEPFLKDADRCLAKGLSDQQTLGMRHILKSRDRVTAIRGKAGTGKTTMMKATIEALEKAGQTVRCFAPTSDATSVLISEGQRESKTVQKLLLNEKLQKELSGCVLWIDEAGLLSSKQMAKLAELSKQHNWRLIFSGDVGQHNAVERGDALRILEAHGGVKPAELDQIFRQKDPIYNDAVRALANGDIDRAFEKFEALDAIHVYSDVDRPKYAAGAYIRSLDAERSALCVSPTHAEGQQITEYIRMMMEATKKLTGPECTFTRLKSLNWTQAQLSDPKQFRPGMVVQAHARMGKLSKDFRGKVVSIEEGTVKVQDKKGRFHALDLSQAEKFSVFEEKEIELMVGDRIRISRNGQTKEGKQLNNGSLHTVQAIKANGDLVLDKGMTLPADYAHFAHGYCVTSHASQGKTVDDVIICESSMSFPAASLEQFYVSASRGRQRLRIFTDDKDALKDAIRRTCARKAASDIQWDADRQLSSKKPSILGKAVHAARYWYGRFGASLRPKQTFAPSVRDTSKSPESSPKPLARPIPKLPAAAPTPEISKAETPLPIPPQPKPSPPIEIDR
jgi:conjugative relaxase-like TrwC/TraI family protein